MFKNFFNFLNPKTNSNRIYSREDIAQMSTDEFSKKRDAIYEQMKMIGIPSKNVLANSSDVVYVQEYTRGNGEVVRAHYRSKPNGISMLHKEEYENLDNTNSFLSDNITKLYDNLTAKNNKDTPVFKLSATYNDVANPSGLVKGADDVKNNYDYMPDAEWKEKERAYYKDIERKIEAFRQNPDKVKKYVNINAITNFGTRDSGLLFKLFLKGINDNNFENQAEAIPNDLNYALKKKYNINVQPGWQGVAFKIDSSLATSLSKSKELKQEIEKSLENGKQDIFTIEIKSDINLMLAIHKATIFNLKKNDGFYEGYLFDNYDFGDIDKNSNFALKAINNKAIDIQNDFGMNYYIIVPFRIPIE